MFKEHGYLLLDPSMKVYVCITNPYRIHVIMAYIYLHECLIFMVNLGKYSQFPWILFLGYVSTNASLPRPSEAVKNSPQELMKGNEKK